MNMTAAAEPSNNDDIALNRSCQSALSWSTLKSIILSSDLVKLARSEEQKHIYRQGRNRIRDQWDSMYDYLLCVKFGFEETINEISGKKRSKPCFEVLKTQWGSESVTSYKMVLCLNDYPYYLEHGIEHWILWKLGGHDVEDNEINQAKLKILCHCTLVDCIDIDDGIDMQVNSDLPTVALAKEELNAMELKMVHDDSIFLHWVNPPHLKRLVIVHCLYIVFSLNNIFSDAVPLCCRN
jgi:hypothetical protein